MDNGEQVKNYKRRVEIFLEDHDWGMAEEYCNRILDIDPEDSHAYYLLTLAENKAADGDELIKQRIDIKSTKHYKRIMAGHDAHTIEMVNNIVAEYESALLNDKYNTAAEYQQRNTPSSLNQAIRFYSEISGYLDADEKRQQCIEALPKANNQKKKIIMIGSSILALILVIAIVTPIVKAANHAKYIASLDPEEIEELYKEALDKKGDGYIYRKGGFFYMFTFDDSGRYSFSTNDEGYANLSNYDEYQGVYYTRGDYQIISGSSYFISTRHSDFDKFYLPDDPFITPKKLEDSHGHVFK